MRKLRYGLVFYRSFTVSMDVRLGLRGFCFFYIGFFLLVVGWMIFLDSFGIVGNFFRVVC